MKIYKVQLIMTVRVDEETTPVEAAQQWLPYPHELPLSSTHSALLAIDFQAAGPS